MQSLIAFPASPAQSELITTGQGILMTRSTLQNAFIRPILLLALLAASACNNVSGMGGSGTNFIDLDTAICEPDEGPFTLQIDNPFFPLPVGRVLEFEGIEAGVPIGLKIEVKNETQVVAGVTTRVVEETHTESGEMIEFSRNFFVQAPDGTVCYYGEEVDLFQNGVVTGHGGTWHAGEGPNLPGIVMPGSPQLDTEFAQELAPGVAEDMSAIVGLGESVSVPEGDFTNVLHTIDWAPLDGQTSADGEDKFYAPDVGLIQDSTAELVSFTP